MTSFEFILDCVPDPVCQTTNGKLSSNLPSITSPAASTIALPSFGSSDPWVMLACAQAFLITPSARTMAMGCFSQPIGKLIIERWVCAPQYLSEGTSHGPKLSVSVRVFVIWALLSRIRCIAFTATNPNRQLESVR